VNGRVVFSEITTHHVTRHNTHIHNILSAAPRLRISQKTLGTLPEDGNVMLKHVGATIHKLIEYLVYLLVFHAYLLLGILIFKGLTARRLYKSFGVKELILRHNRNVSVATNPTLLFCLQSELSVAGGKVGN
jgi:hypothetical protein